jgi:Tryptophan-associated transmembrane protein (Trp_oprn_chp)
VIRLSQLLLLLSAGALWAASRMVWVEVQSFDGLGQPKTAALTGASWSTALVPLAVLLLAISLWVIRDVAVRAAHLAGAQVADLTGTQRHYGGAIVTLVAAVVTLVAAVLLVRSAARAKPEAARYARRTALTSESAAVPSERAIWDALDEGSDPTRDPADPENKGR